jgi:VWFA-related protein
VDVTVVGHDGLPVDDLAADDFELREDGIVQRIQLFEHHRLTGEPSASSDESLVIRSPDHALQEAAREDVRLLVLFIDDYHLRAGALEDTRLRRELTRFIKSQMRPLDLFAVMGPLTPISDLGLTRDMNALLKRVNAVQGRLGGFVPPRSVVEEAQTRLGPRDLARVRAQISLSALESLVVHLGGLRDGRKSVLFISQGPPLGTDSLELFSDLRAVVGAANRNNVIIHTLDPRQLGETRQLSDANEALANDTGGRRIGLTNDFSRALDGVMADASAYYLLGYESPKSANDGKFHRLDVRVRRKGVHVVARKGYWSPTPEESRTVTAVSKGPEAPPDIAEAIEALRMQARREIATDWIGLEPNDQGSSMTTVACEPVAGHSSAIASVEVQVTRAGEPAATHAATRGADLWVARFPSPPGQVKLRVTVKDRAGEVLETWAREFTVAATGTPASRIGTPVVYRPAGAVQARALVAGAEASLTTTRHFRHGDRVFVRLPVKAITTSTVEAQLLDQHGHLLTTLTVVTPQGRGLPQVDLPLGSLALADYLLRFTVSAPDGQTTALVPFTLAP